jgi:hypothetical protein
MSNLGITHTAQYDFKNEQWIYETVYSVTLASGETVSGRGYDGLVKALVELRSELEALLAKDAERENDANTKAKIKEISLFIEYLREISALAHKKEMKAEIAVERAVKMMRDDFERVPIDEPAVTALVEFDDLMEVSSTIDVVGEVTYASSIDVLSVVPVSVAGVREPGM